MKLEVNKSQEFKLFFVAGIQLNQKDFFDFDLVSRLGKSFWYFLGKGFLLVPWIF